MSLAFAQEPFTNSLLESMVPLIVNHHREITIHKQTLEPNFAMYDVMQKNGTLRVYTARMEGELVGYSIFIVHPHQHFKNCLQASEDLLYLSDECRQGLIGYNFIKFCDGMLDKDGVNLIYHKVTTSKDFSPLLDRLGYVPVETVYARRVQ